MNSELDVNRDNLEQLLVRRRERRRGLGMRVDQIQRLTSSVVTDAMSKDMKEDCCSICLDDFKSNMTIRQMAECGHCFHQSCIDQWLSRKDECPNCKTSQTAALRRSSMDTVPPNLDPLPGDNDSIEDLAAEADNSLSDLGSNS